MDASLRLLPRARALAICSATQYESSFRFASRRFDKNNDDGPTWSPTDRPLRTPDDPLRPFLIGAAGTGCSSDYLPVRPEVMFFRVLTGAIKSGTVAVRRSWERSVALARNGSPGIQVSGLRVQGEASAAKSQKVMPLAAAASDDNQIPPVQSQRKARGAAPGQVDTSTNTLATLTSDIRFASGGTTSGHRAGDVKDAPPLSAFLTPGRIQFRSHSDRPVRTPLRTSVKPD